MHVVGGRQTLDFGEQKGWKKNGGLVFSGSVLLDCCSGRFGRKVTSGFFSPGEALLNSRSDEPFQVRTVSLTHSPDGSS